VVIALGVAGLAAAVVLSMLRGADADTRFQATAAILFQISTDEPDALQKQLTEAQALAHIAAQSIIAESPDSRFITIDSVSGQLRFHAITSSGPLASETATAMRKAYLDVDPLAGGASVEERLVQLEEEAGRLTDQLASLVSSDSATIEQHQFIASQVTQLRQRLLDLAVLKATADSATRAAYEIEISQIELALEELAAEEALLSPLEPDNPSVAFQQGAIQQRLDVLAVEYARLYLRKLGVTTGGTLLPVTVADLTPPPPSLAINGLLGVVVGLGLAALAISVDARVRRPVWVADDVSLPVLGDIPSRRTQTEPGRAWYDAESKHPRKHAVQAFRAAVEGRLPGRSYSIALAGIRSGSSMTQAAVMDLGVSFASAGWSVLIVDADLDAGAPAELKGAGPSLAQVLSRHANDQESLRRAASEAIEKATVLRPNVSVISAGTGPESSADALSGTAFQLFLEEATRRHDLVLMVGGDLRTPAGQVLLQRLDYGILCLVPGRSSSDLVEDLAEEMANRGVVFLGATFLRRRGVSIGRTVDSSQDGPVTPPQGMDLRLTRERGSSQPSRDRNRSHKDAAAPGDFRKQTRESPITHVGTPHGREDVVHPNKVSGEEDGTVLRARMLQAVTDVEQGSYESVAGFMVDCVTALLTDPPNGSDFTNDALMEGRSGFLPLHDAKGRESVGTILNNEFRSQLGAKLGSWLAAEAALVLSEGFGATGVTLTLDEWLAHEYFVRHIEERGSEPTVWHLASRHGTVEVLVDSARFDQDCIDELRRSIVEGRIDPLERNLKSAVRAGKAEAIERLGEQLSDARTFEIALGWLYEGTTPNARLMYPSMLANQQPRGWNPIWSEGIKPNIAPLQRLGLLAAPVLTDVELQQLRPTG
jgi:xanthosine utilization system XapX-like protein